MQDKLRNKLQEKSHKLSRWVTVFLILSYVGIIFTFYINIMLYNSNHLSESFTVQGILVNTEYGDTSRVLMPIRIVAFTGLVQLILLAVILKRMKKLFVSFAVSPSPFTSKTIVSLKKMAWVMAFFAAAPTVLNFILRLTMTGGSVLDFSIMIEFAPFILLLVFIVLISIFEYGFLLQQEADETL